MFTWQPVTSYHVWVFDIKDGIKYFNLMKAMTHHRYTKGHPKQ